MRSLGIDLGIASCGWALIEENDAAEGRIVALGVRSFEAPEEAKDKTPRNQVRRQHRGLRRVLRRRRQRMAAVRALFAAHGLLETAAPDALALGLDPWQLRAEALERVLSGAELAVALGHIAKHRGFRSNRKRASNAPDDDSKEMLKAIEASRQRLAHYRTVGEMFARDPAFAGRKRNREGDYSRSILRTDQEHEVRVIFERQRALGSAVATEALRDAFAEVAFFQRPLASAEDRVGPCPFEPEEKRAAKRACSFELFRFLARLTALRVGDRRSERALTEEEIARAAEGFGTQQGMTFARLRRVLALPDTLGFIGVPAAEESKRDVVNRAAGNGCMRGSAALREAIGEASWRRLLATPAVLDEIAFVLSFAPEAEVAERLEALGLEEEVRAAILAGLDQGAFADFTGAGHLSAKACRAIIPFLRQGLVYSEACARAGYDHARRPLTPLEAIANPVARKAIGEALKQVRAIVAEHGLPDRIHIELARDVGRSAEERKQIEKGIEDRNKALDRLRERFIETVGQEPRGAEDMLRFELWQEQGGRCLYTDRAIPPAAILAGDNTVQVDHILPWSRFGDDSFVNKTLCFVSANQEKRGRTPYEWLGSQPERWEAFVARVETIRGMKGRKKRNYTLKDAARLEEKFRTRNLNDTRYAARIVAEHLARLWPEDGTRRVFARPGALTDRLRRAWGLQDLKKALEPDGARRREDDRHHALDALIVAATSESALQRLTRAFQAAEAAGSHRDFAGFPPPWRGFVEAAREAFRTILVSRAERGRARGEAHAATIREVRQEEGGAVVYERRAVETLKEEDLRRVKDPGRNAALIGSLRAWIAAGKPKDRPPLSPKGDPIRKVRLATDKKVDVAVRGGAAERGEMVRVDVFRARNRKGAWEFFLVPIYPHQVADRARWPTPPDRAVAAHKPEEEWPVMDGRYEFLFSLQQRSFVEVEKPDGTVITGYFMGMDRQGGQIVISAPHSTKALARGIGTRTLRRFEKFRVDRLGRVFPVARETRTWHGVPCT